MTPSTYVLPLLPALLINRHSSLQSLKMTGADTSFESAESAIKVIRSMPIPIPANPKARVYRRKFDPSKNFSCCWLIYRWPDPGSSSPPPKRCRPVPRWANPGKSKPSIALCSVVRSYRSDILSNTNTLSQEMTCKFEICRVKAIKCASYE
jgi:hypothetical protein